MRLRFLGIIVPLAGLLVSTTSASAASEKFNPPKHYYLALGDSLAYGYQDAKFKAEASTGHIDPATFPGYAGDFEVSLQRIRPNIEEVNYGCPAETTVSYFQGCAFNAVLGLPLHNGYTGSQEAAALAFLRAHPGQVSPITLDNGANDVTPCLNIKTPEPCFAAAIAGVSANMDVALAHLRAAAPDAEIIVMAYYDPFALFMPSSLAVTQQLNAVIKADAAKYRARVADAFTPFNVSPAPGDDLCNLTLICPPTFDEHASDSGYALIAKQFWAASGYSRLGD